MTPICIKIEMELKYIIDRPYLKIRGKIPNTSLPEPTDIVRQTFLI